MPSDVLVFAVPLALALLLWIASLTGLFGLFDADGADAPDAHADGGDAGGVGDLLGGLPLSLGLTLLLFGFGEAGLLLRVVAGVGLGLSLGAAAVLAVLLTRGLGSRLRPVFRDAPAPHAARLVGRVATVTSERVDTAFGTASLRGENGAPLSVAVRLSPDLPHAAAPAYGTPVLLYDFDPARNVYLAAPHAPS